VLPLLFFINLVCRFPAVIVCIRPRLFVYLADQVRRPLLDDGEQSALMAVACFSASFTFFPIEAVLTLFGFRRKIVGTFFADV